MRLNDKLRAELRADIHADRFDPFQRIQSAKVD